MTTNSRASAQPPRKPTLTGSILSAIAGLVVSVFGSLIFGTALEWVGMRYWWKDQGVNHSRAMVKEDLEYLSEYRRSLLTDDTVMFAARWAQTATDVLTVMRIPALIEKGSEPLPATAVSPKTRFVRQALTDMAPYLTAMIYVWQDAAIRLAIAFLAVPAFVLAFLFGLIDGLARRDIRKWSGGRESSFVYHHSKRLIWPAFTGGFFLYLTWPSGGFNPAWMVLPFCAAVAWTVSLMAATFKKYL